jgi:hypothetical protein
MRTKGIDCAARLGEASTRPLDMSEMPMVIDECAGIPGMLKNGLLVVNAR